MSREREANKSELNTEKERMQFTSLVVLHKFKVKAGSVAETDKKINEHKSEKGSETGKGEPSSLGDMTANRMDEKPARVTVLTRTRRHARCNERREDKQWTRTKAKITLLGASNNIQACTIIVILSLLFPAKLHKIHSQR